MHLYISKAKGLYHCFYAGCEFNGILTDYCKDKRSIFSYPKEKSSDRTGTCPPPERATSQATCRNIEMRQKTA